MRQEKVGGSKDSLVTTRRRQSVVDLDDILDVLDHDAKELEETGFSTVPEEPANNYLGIFEDELDERSSRKADFGSDDAGLTPVEMTPNNRDRMIEELDIPPLVVFARDQEPEELKLNTKKRSMSDKIEAKPASSIFSFLKARAAASRK